MKFFSRTGAPNPRRVFIFLAEKKLDPPFEIIELDIFANEHKNDQFRQTIPLQRLPTLELDDGTILTESIAICRYFEELYPDPALMGKNPLEKAIIEMWNRRMELNLLAPAAAAFRHLHPKMANLEVPQVAEWGEANKPKTVDMLKIMDAQLKSASFIAGEEFSIADITALMGLEMLRPARIELPDNCENLQGWWHHMKSRDSYNAGMA